MRLGIDPRCTALETSTLTIQHRCGFLYLVKIIKTLLKCVFQGQQTADVVWELDLTKELKGVAMERYMRNYKTEFFIPVALVRFLHS